jgi:lactobin A/cerein 7B family class IIb bacteriocin
MQLKGKLDVPGLIELGQEEMKMVDGGLAPIWWAVIWSAVSNFGDIRQGFSDGLSGKPPSY